MAEGEISYISGQNMTTLTDASFWLQMQTVWK